MTDLKVAKNLSLPMSVVADSLAIIARKGRGKTYAASVLAEEMLEQGLQLAEEVEMTPTGGTFQTYLATLRRNGLVDVDGSFVRASETLFLGN